MDWLVDEVRLVWSLVKDQRIRVSIYCLHCSVYKIVLMVIFDWEWMIDGFFDLEVKMRVGKGGVCSQT